MTQAPPDLARARVARARMEKMAWLLDGVVRVPGTRFRFGLDSVIGLVPGVGDAIGLLLGAAILYESVRVGAPRSLLLKMVGNSLADMLGGMVPVAGDLFDFAFRANQRNARLLVEHLDGIGQRPGPPPAPRSTLAGLLLVALVLLAAAVPLVLFGYWLLDR